MIRRPSHLAAGAASREKVPLVSIILKLERLAVDVPSEVDEVRVGDAHPWRGQRTRRSGSSTGWG
eukprot:3527342-Pyramimonas_sp.AAC.1